MKQLLIWDSKDTPPEGDWQLVLWSHPIAASMVLASAISIPKQVERECDELRMRYLNWVDSLASLNIEGKSVVDHLKLKSGLSYWWMCSLAQKFNSLKSSKINDAIRALALEGLLKKNKPEEIILNSENAELRNCLSEYCSAHGIYFKCNGSAKKNQNIKKTFIRYRSLIMGLAYLIWYIFNNSYQLFRAKKNAEIEAAEILFVDILAHLKNGSVDNGIFASNYWTVLVDRLEGWGVKTNWLHIFFRHEAVPSISKAENLSRRFNSKKKGIQYHQMIESNFSFGVLISAGFNFIKIFRSYNRLSQIAKIMPEGSRFNIWNFHESDWIDSICGKQAMTNCIRASLIDTAVMQYSKVRLGIYIAENQPWEMALIHAWRSFGHGKLVAVQHSTVRYWDLRYFHGRHQSCSSLSFETAMPDYFAVNGPEAYSEMLHSGYPEEKIIGLEALRYLHLNGVSKKFHAASSDNEMSILFCGDFLKESNELLFVLMDDSCQNFPESKVILKPHPAYLHNSDCLNHKNFFATDVPLEELLPTVDVVVTTNLTSASVDAYCTGKMVIQIYGGNDLNLSPLRNIDGVAYVSTAEELRTALRSYTKTRIPRTNQFFFLDENLYRWEKLVMNNEAVDVQHAK